MVTENKVVIGLLGIWVVRGKGEYMENKDKIEIIYTGPATAKVFLNGQELHCVTGYRIEHEANSIAKLELIVGKGFNEVELTENCEVTIRQEGD